jgi:hypothetical protein
MILSKKYLVLLTTRLDLLTTFSEEQPTNTEVRLILIDASEKKSKALFPFLRLLPSECKDFEDMLIFRDQDGLFDAIDLSSLPQNASEDDFIKLCKFNDLFD